LGGWKQVQREKVEGRKQERLRKKKKTCTRNLPSSRDSGGKNKTGPERVMTVRSGIAQEICTDKTTPKKKVLEKELGECQEENTTD